MSVKKATSVEEQIEILKSRGIVIQDENKAKEILLDIGYFRLGFYCFPFEKNYPNRNNRDHVYKVGTELSDIVRLYYFDYNLRNIILKFINRIEINFRTYLTYTVSNKYMNSPTWFADPSVVNNTYVDTFESKVYNTTFLKNPIIKRHHKKHLNDKFAPAWKTLEFMTFGSILVLYNNLKNVDLKRHIAEYYGIKSIAVFSNYMETIRVIRNTCAHGSVLFDISLPESIKAGPAGFIEGCNRHNLKGATTIVSYVLKQVSANRGIDMDNEINQLLVENKDIVTVVNAIKNCSGYCFTNILK